MKKIYTVVAMMLTTLLLFSGCASVHYDLDIQQDQSVQVDATLLMDTTVYALLDELGVEPYRQQLRASGFETEYISEEGKEGFTASITLNNLEALTKSPTQILPIESLSYGSSSFLFGERFSMVAQLDMTDFVSSLQLLPIETTPVEGEESDDTESEEEEDEEPTAEELAEEQLKQAIQAQFQTLSASDLSMTVTITMPQAMVTEDDNVIETPLVDGEVSTAASQGRSVTWQISSAGPDEIRFETVRWNVLMIVLFALLTLLPLVGALVLYVRYRQGRQLTCRACGTKNFYKRPYCRSCNNKIPLGRRRVVHNRMLLSVVSAVVGLVLGGFVGVSIMTMQLSVVETNHTGVSDADLVSLINQIAQSQQVVDPNGQATPEQTTSEETSSETSEPTESAASQITELTVQEKVDILIAVATEQEEALAQYDSDDYWDARTYLGDAFQPVTVMQALFTADEEEVDTIFNNYVIAGIIDQTGTVQSLLKGYRPSTQSEAISEQEAIQNAESYLNNLAVYVPANVEISESDDTTYTVHFYDGNADDPTNEIFHRVDKFTGQVLADY